MGFEYNSRHCLGKDVRPLNLRGHMYKYDHLSCHPISNPVIFNIDMFGPLMVDRIHRQLPSRTVVNEDSSGTTPLEVKILQ